MKKLSTLIAIPLIMSGGISFAQDNINYLELLQDNGKLIYSDAFNHSMEQWVVEKTDKTEVGIIEQSLDIDDGAGVTVWFKEDIGTPSVIEFNGSVVVAGGKNDRGTDLNFFWMAQEPGSVDFFAKSEWRSGNMRKYDPMRLYYIGYGANDNSTTRFRRYPGDGTRPLLPEYDVKDPAFMNVPNKYTNIKIFNLDDEVLVYANDKLLYHIEDEKMFESGKFGFRTWKSHLRIDDFKVYAIKLKK